MDWHLVLLFVAIVATYLAWRRAQRQAEVERARAAALEEPRWRYTLLEAPAGDGLGPGYDVAGAAGGPLDAHALRWDEHGIEVIDVAAGPESAAALLDPTFAAGAGVRLEAGTAPDGTASVALWNEDGSTRAAVLGGPLAAHLHYILEKGDLGDCIILREAARDAGAGRRGADAAAGVRLLLVHRDTDVAA